VSKLKRYRQITTILIKYLYQNVSARAGAGSEKAKNLRLALERLGPTFIKFGQALTNRPDLMDMAYLSELEKLQDDVPPFPSDEASRIVETELGKPLDEVFLKFSQRSWASASLAQVHTAYLLDGREIALKIQRPGIKDIIEGDISILYNIASYLDRSRYGKFYNFHRFVDEFRETILNELDFRKEGRNIERLAENLKYFNHIHLPKVYWNLTTEHLLAMERIEGVKINNFTELNKLEINRSLLAKELMSAFLKQIIEDGFFHADPHLGNLLVETDGRVALLDLGMVGRLDINMRDQVGRLLIGFAEQNSQEVANIILEAGTKSENTNIKALKQDVGSLVVKYQYMVASEMGIGKALVNIVKLALEHNVMMPQGFNLLGRSLLYLDNIAFNLAPELDYVAFIKGSAKNIYMERFLSQNSLSKISRSALEANKLTLEGFGQVNSLLDKLVNNEITIRFEHEHLQGMIKSLNLSANRLAFAIIIASLIIGSAFIIRVSSTKTVLGLPIFGLTGFALAAFFGIILLVRIITTERR